MKKLLTLFLATFLLSGALGVGKAQALSFEPDGNKFLIDGFSYLTETQDSLWGIFSIGTLSYWEPSSDDMDGAQGSTYWTKGQDGEYLAIKFGGIVAPALGEGGVATWDVADSFAQLWLLDFDAFSTDPLSTNSDVIAGPGDGAIDSFGVNIATGTLLLEMEFDSFITKAGLDLSGKPQTDALGYLSVVDGPLADIFDSNFFQGLYDVGIQGTNVPLPDSDWNYTANQYSAYATVVPEPGTILLLGVGLLGLAAGARRRN